ncbi:serine/arginine repetitive matrix protein 2 [Oryza brachyantha]|uniref:serine/arginine repetitive matrix protein 2 n=1 Tax=Oryza brachyantha TaxID=4533 RepID=UPI0003EA8607|nr:serine/arginine repetitive matrix protein 2 [Oryza brachyantha]
MKTKSSRKAAAADEDEAKSKKLRSSRGKRRRGRHSRSSSSSRSESPARKRSKKLRIADKKSTKNKGGSRRRHRSPSPSSSSTCYSSRISSSDPERSVSPPRRSHSRDVRKKERGRDSKRGRRSRRSTRSYSTSGESSASSRSRSRSKGSKSRKRRSGGGKDYASRDKIVQDYDNGHGCRAEDMETMEDANRDERAVALNNSKGSSIDHEKNSSAKKTESPPTKNADETEDTLPDGSGSPDAQDLELILRQKALENFRKFRGTAVMAGKTHTDGTGKEVVMDSPKSSDMKIAEANSVDQSFQRQRSGLSMNHSAGSPRLEDYGDHTAPRKQESSAGKNLGTESPGTFVAGSTSEQTEQNGGSLEPTRSNSQTRLHDGRSSSSIMQRLGSPPRSSVSAKQRLGSSVGMSYVNGNPRVRSVVSIPTNERLDSGTYITPHNACDNSSPAERISEVRHPPIETNKAERTNGDERKKDEASASNVSTLSTSEAKDQPGTEVKDGSQFEKKTFSRMHEGETVQVSYKVYIPKKSPALARRKLQR